jgi:hypothetical protein
MPCALLLLAGGCGDDKSSGPRNRAPEITTLQVDPDTIGMAGCCEIACVASDPDGDPLAFSWDPGPGGMTGTGPSVMWTAPEVVGTCTVSVTVSDGEGGEASEAIMIEVVGASFVVQSKDGLMAVDLQGDVRQLSDLSEGSQTGVEVVGTRIFLELATMIELDHDGNVVATTPYPPGVEYHYGFSAIPDGRFAMYDNANDKVYFMDAQGGFLRTVDIPQASGSGQFLGGVVVGNKLIVSETGTDKLFEIDLATYQTSIFKDVGDSYGMLTDIDYVRGTYYLGTCQQLLSFVDGGEIDVISTFEEPCLHGIAVHGRYAYVVLSFPGEIHKIDLSTGEQETLASGLDYAQDIEFIPVSLEGE